MAEQLSLRATAGTVEPCHNYCAKGPGRRNCGRPHAQGPCSGTRQAATMRSPHSHEDPAQPKLNKIYQELSLQKANIPSYSELYMY